ncbi:MAG: phosphopantetheine-binding protein [Desulfatirhabdiaceae bacterium]
MTLKEQLKIIIVKDLNLTDILPEDIGDNDPLFDDKFGLDSIDAVELVFQIKNHFGVTIKNLKEGRTILQSIHSISTFIEKQRGA